MRRARVAEVKSGDAMSDTNRPPAEPTPPAIAPAGTSPTPPLTGAARDWDRALRMLDRGLWASRIAALVILLSPVICFFLYIFNALPDAGWFPGIIVVFDFMPGLLFLAGWVAWGIGLRRLRHLAGSARARRDLGVALASMLAFPLCGLCLFIQTTPAGGVLTSATALVLLGMNLLLTRVALDGLAGEAGCTMSRSLDIEFWPLIVSCFGLPLCIPALLGGGVGWFVTAVLFVAFGLLIAYFKGIGRCRELVMLLRGRWRGESGDSERRNRRREAAHERGAGS